MNIGLFGGSFNPVHNAHLAVAQKVLDEFNLDEIWFLPTGKHPFKEEIKFLDFRKRTDLLEKALQNFPQLKVKDFDAPGEDFNYTSDLLKKIFRLFPDDTFYFIIGEDNVIELPLWNDYRWLVDKANFIVVNRPNTNKNRWQKLGFIHKLRFVTMKPLDISSKLIRNLVKRKRDISELVPPEINELVQELYKDF